MKTSHRKYIEGVATKEYRTWYAMRQRCHQLSGLKGNESYRECSIAPEWEDFNTFAQWMSQQVYFEGYHLDKDILGEGNTYAPEVCVFVPAILNQALIKQGSKCVNKLPSGRYQARHSVRSVRVCLGTYDSEAEAQQVYLKARNAYLIDLLVGHVVDDRVFDKITGGYYEVYNI